MRGSFYCQWHITDKCNLSCKHCYQNAICSYTDVDCSRLFLIADELIMACEKWKSNLEVAITGGEPFVRHDDLFSLLNYLDQNEIVTRIDILSNGILITDEIARNLKEIYKLGCVQISLESPHRDTHDEIRGVGAFDKAIAAIKLLKSYDIKVSVMMTLSKLNYKDIESMWYLLSSVGVDYFGVDRFIPEERDVYEFNGNVLDKDELSYAFKTIARIAVNNAGITPKVCTKRPLFCLIGSDGFGGSCSAGGSTLTILPNGDILPCRRLPIKLGNVFQDGIFKIWYTNDVLWKLRDINQLNKKCNGCKHLNKCKGCRAMAYAVNGDFMGEDVLCWKN